MSLKFYYDLMSQPSRAVYIFLKFNGVEFEHCPIALRKGEHLTEEYAKINPFQRVPFVDDNGFKLSESCAILKYLTLKYKTPKHWYPTGHEDLEKTSRIDEFLHWQHLNLRLNGSLYFRHTLGVNGPKDEQKAENYKIGLQENLNQLENYFLQNDSAFVNRSNCITIADLICSCELEQPISVGFDFTQQRPKLKNYMDRVKNHLGLHYEEAHKFSRILAAERKDSV